MDAAAEYQTRFSTSPSVVVRAPGRVNLIGEHTDYNDGLVMPFAIEPAVYVLAGRGENGVIHVYTSAFDESVRFPCDVSTSSPTLRWQNYVRGVVAGLRAKGVAVPGANLCITGDLPPGGGLGSSAALCVGAALALLNVAGASLPMPEIADLSRRAEHDFAGTPCGIMDPYVCLFGKRGHALLLDCKTRLHEYVPLELPGVSLLLLDTGVKHELADGAYALRVQECRNSVSVIAKSYPEVTSLSDVTLPILEQVRDELGPTLVRRVRHVVTENERVRTVAGALRRGDVEEVGRCLTAGHRSLRDDYEVSCPEIEDVMTLLSGIPGVLGARMVGGGFGGNILVIVRSDSVDVVWEKVIAGHPTRSPSMTLSEVSPGEGASHCGRF